MELKLSDGATLSLPDELDKGAKFIADTINRHGATPDGQHKMDWSTFVSLLQTKDAVNTPDIKPLLSKAVEMIYREPVEIPPIITGLFNRVMAKGLNHLILGGAIGGVVAASDVAEGGKYPEVMFDIGGNVQTAAIGKSGIQAAFSYEALRYSTWDIFSINARFMNNALIRHKEQKASAFLRGLGTTLFDNVTPSESLYGVATGRDINMAANGVPIMDDLFKAITHMSMEGFTPDTILVHPLMFLMWTQDAVLRNMMVLTGVGTEYFRTWSGNPGPRDPWSNGAMGALGPTTGQFIHQPGGSVSGESATPVSGYSPLANSYTTPPGYLPWRMNIVVSPLVPFDPDTNTTDIILLSSGNVGMLLQDEDLTRIEWDDQAREVVYLRFRERYTFGVMWEGQGIGLMKNMKVGRNYWDGTIQFTRDAPTSEIDPSVPVAI